MFKSTRVNAGKIKAILFLLGIGLIPLALESAYLRNVPVQVRQPDGEIISLFASGDEFYNWIHDANGYTIVRNPETGYFVYAGKKDGALFPSSRRVSSQAEINLQSVTFLSIPQHLTHSPDMRLSPQLLFPQGSPANPEEIFNAPRIGTINNIVIFIRFSDESEFTDSISTYDQMFNDNTAGANSMRNYFVEASYSQLSISTTFYPTPSTTVVSYQDSHPRAYYQVYNAVTNPIGYVSYEERTEREHTLLKNAVDAVSSQIPGGLVVDGDGDGRVDNVCFIISGGPEGWAELLWPHMWSLYSQYAYINGKRVYTFNFQLRNSLLSSGVGVLCHEMFHSLGAPDLYHYSYDGLHPVYTWGIMEYTSNPPRHMGAFMKYRYGTWISSVPEITSDGTYSLNPLTSSTNNCYKIASPFSSSEYFLVEYRRRLSTFENSLPGEGLLVYRINSNQDGQGNRNGPPDEVYIYRPGGTIEGDGSPLLANFSSNAGRIAINDGTNPSSFLSDGSVGGLNISNVGSVAGTISFDVSFSLPTMIFLSKSLLNFGTATPGGEKTSNQQFSISKSGEDTLNWTISDNAGWLSCSPVSGTDEGLITVSVETSGLSVGSYTGTITITSAEAINSPQTLPVYLTVYTSGTDSAPIGVFDTPADGLTVSGSVPVTGWALDDIEVSKVEIKREPDPDDPPGAAGGDGLVYIGDAVFVRGSRPDVEGLYPNYPLNDRGGWGYMMLTYGLPSLGNGTFRLYAFAEDDSGHRVLLGTKQITSDNANRVNPFGTIDTPNQGETISGTFINFGWALTPPPKMILTDGSTIWISIDGVFIAHPVYNQFRQDIYDSFPGYLNRDGAVGFYYLETAGYSNGVHTIGWYAVDNNGDADGFGSRFFEIQNAEGAPALMGGLDALRYKEDRSGRLKIGVEGPQRIESEQLERVKIVLKAEGGGRFIGWGSDETRSLPIGSTLDSEQGIFYWSIGPGFLNRFILHFAVTDGRYRSRPVRIEINVFPKKFDARNKRLGARK
jgi:M6 family metalloprotease-like protein